MTVAQLIKELQKFPGDAEIFVTRDSEEPHDAKSTYLHPQKGYAYAGTPLCYEQDIGWMREEGGHIEDESALYEVVLIDV